MGETGNGIEVPEGFAVGGRNTARTLDDADTVGTATAGPVESDGLNRSARAGGGSGSGKDGNASGWYRHSYPLVREGQTGITSGVLGINSVIVGSAGRGCVIVGVNVDGHIAADLGATRI